jgi:hypothetical protein
MVAGMATQASTGPDPDDVALLHKQLDYYQSWLCSLTQAPLQAVALNSMQSAVRVVVSGFPDTASAEVSTHIYFGRISDGSIACKTTSTQHIVQHNPSHEQHTCSTFSTVWQQHWLQPMIIILLPTGHCFRFSQDLRNIFEGLIAANQAAVAPGSAVKSCDIQPGSPASAVLQLRCSAEASNCLAFDGLVWNTAVLKVNSSMDAFLSYCSSLTAVTPYKSADRTRKPSLDCLDWLCTPLPCVYLLLNLKVVHWRLSSSCRHC